MKEFFLSVVSLIKLSLIVYTRKDYFSKLQMQNLAVSLSVIKLKDLCKST